MTGTDVLGLKVLELAVDVVALAHSVFKNEIKWSFSGKKQHNWKLNPRRNRKQNNCVRQEKQTL
jgi:hypothetical protein